MRNQDPNVVTASGIEVHTDNSVHMFLHHMQLAVSFLETTPLTEAQVCKVISDTRWSTLSETMAKFCATVACGCFIEFEWEEEKPDEETLTDDMPDVQIMALKADDPDFTKKLHNFIVQFGND